MTRTPVLGYLCISTVYPNSNQGQNILKANCLSKTFHMRILLCQKIFWVNKIKFYNSIFYCFSVLVVLASCPWLNWKTPWLKSKKCSKREATLLNISHHPSLPIIEKRKNNVKLESYYYFSYSLRLDLSLNLFCTFWYIVLTYWKILTRTFFLLLLNDGQTYYKFNYIFDKKLVNKNDD